MPDIQFDYCKGTGKCFWQPKLLIKSIFLCRWNLKYDQIMTLLYSRIKITITFKKMLSGLFSTVSFFKVKTCPSLFVILDKWNADSNDQTFTPR